MEAVAEKGSEARIGPVGLFASLFVEPIKERNQFPLGRYSRARKQYIVLETGKPAIIRCDGSCTVSGSCQSTDTSNGSDSDSHDDSDTDNS